MATLPKVGTSTARHLVFLCHGLHGTADDLQYLQKSLQAALGSDALVVCFKFRSIAFCSL